MSKLIVCRNCTESDCAYCNMNILAVALERGYFNSLMREQHTVQIDSELIPVRHGHWEIDEKRYGNKDPHCSICRAILEGDADKCRNNYYCYHCGAKMDEVKNGTD